MRKLCILFTVLISKSCSLISLPILEFDYYHIKEFEYYNEKYVYDCYTTLELEYLIVGYIIKEADVNKYIEDYPNLEYIVDNSIKLSINNKEVHNYKIPIYTITTKGYDNYIALSYHDEINKALYKKNKVIKM